MGGKITASRLLFNSFGYNRKKKVEAIIGSIEKWHGILFDNAEDRGIDNCPLCKLYFKKDCEGCPVRGATHLPFCRKTPYVSWVNLWDKVGIEEMRLSELDAFPAEQKLAKKHARGELWFLVKLLPMGIEARMKDLTIYYRKE